MKDNLNINELIRVDQLPHVFEQLDEISKWIDDGLKTLDLDNLVVSEDNKQNLKKTRTEINNISSVLENKRKEIKEKILEPYELFEQKYNQEVKSKLSDAANKLTIGINEIETKQKLEKENNLREFFDNYQQEYHLEDIISFEDIGLNITLTASEKSLKDQIVAFVNKVSQDFQCIATGENREETLLEYKRNGFNYSQAVITVNDKIKQIKELEQKIVQKAKIDEIEQKVIQNVETLVSIPQEIKEEELIECEFKVITTMEKLQELKKYLNEKGIKYE